MESCIGKHSDALGAVTNICSIVCTQYVFLLFLPLYVWICKTVRVSLVYLHNCALSMSGPHPVLCLRFNLVTLAFISNVVFLELNIFDMTANSHTRY